MAIERGRRLPFIVLPWSLLDHPQLSATDIMVYATIARFADNRTGEAYPSRTTISVLARCSDSTVDRSIKALIQAGYLSKQARRKTTGDPDSNLYTVHEIAEQSGGVASPMKGGGLTSDDWGSRTSDDLTRTNRTRRDDEERTVAEWTPIPDDVRAQIEALGMGETK